MLSSSASRASILAVVLAAVCTVSLFLRESTPRTFHESTQRQLRSRVWQGYKDPKTVRPRLDAVPVLPVISEVSQSDADAPASWWEDIDYDLKWPCGRYKCFFLSSSDPARGYLIADQRQQGGHNALENYNYAKNLKSEFDIRHFLLGPPYQVKTPEHLEYFVGRLAGDAEDKFVRGTTLATALVVQESRAAPPGSKLFKCETGKDVDYLDTIDYLIEHGKEGWKQRLVEEMSDASLLLEAHTELADDFQIMIDREGQIYHLDFDRSHRRAGSPSVSKLIARVENCLEETIAYIRKSMDDPSMRGAASFGNFVPDWK